MKIYKQFLYSAPQKIDFLFKFLNKGMKMRNIII